MYGLFEYTYDYYEFESFVCVSKHIEKLKTFCLNTYFSSPTECEIEHRRLAKIKVSHYMIKKVNKL